MQPNTEQLLHAYPLSPPITLDVLVDNVYLLRSEGQDYALKIHAAEVNLDDQRYEHWLMLSLAQHHLPFELPVPIRNYQGATFHTTPEGAIWTLARKLNGEWMKPNDPDQAYAVGAALAELHRALSQIPPMMPPAGSFYTAQERILPHMQGRLPSEPAQLGLGDTLEAQHRWRRFRYMTEQFQSPPPAPNAELQWHIVHGDFFGANILYNGDAVSGVLDFKKAHPDYRAREFAEILLRVTNDLGPLFWGTARSFVEGYAVHLKLSRAEIHLVPRFLVEYHVERVLSYVGDAPQQAANALRIQEDVSAWLESEQDRLDAMLRGVFWGD